jgi:2-iminobutanoate/2-iminopropanoate deaminase
MEVSIMTRQAVVTNKAPAAIGPYSQAISIDSLVFCSGQLGLDAVSGQMAGGDAVAEAEAVLANVAAVLAAAGSSMDRVLKTTVFLTDLKDFQAVNEVYARHFSSPYPARSTIQVAALPRGAKVEIEAIALRGVCPS